MLARIQECILYRGFSNGEILDDMTELINLYEADEEALTEPSPVRDTLGSVCTTHPR